jgi:uncharacterized protein YndB with AHSA1/START domain
MKPDLHAKSYACSTDRSIDTRQGRYGRLRPLPPEAAHAARKAPVRSNPPACASIRLARRFDAAPEQVFNAWLDPGIAGRWLFATATRPMAQVDIDARVAGAFRFIDRCYGECIEYSGEYIDIVPHRRLAFTLSAHEHPHVMTRVSVEMQSRRRGCLLAVRHDNVPRERGAYTRARWIGMLYGLGVILAAHAMA